MASVIDQMIAELQAALVVLAPQIEGFQDFSRLNLEPETSAQVTTVLKLRQVRQNLVNLALEALTNLKGHAGYPDVPRAEFSPAAYDDLMANVGTIAAAFGQADVGLAANLNLAVGEPEPK